MFFLAIVLFVCPIFLCVQAQARDLTIDELSQAASLDFGLTEFKDEFSSILKNLVELSWDESGDWKGDIQGDATYFAPMLLYALWKDTGAYALRSMADETVDHEVAMVYWVRCLSRAYHGHGHRVSLPGRDLSGNKEKALPPHVHPRGERGKHARHVQSRLFRPNMYDRASTYGSIILMCFTAYELTGDDVYKEEGLALMSLANRECWNEEKGLYAYSRYADWPQAH
ncbi:MAG: hypothetical protein MZU95_14445 [Desulfomicrobium escambiense]|nr:hypothetical protein [Desulfomicrobium escambiense]